MRIDVALVERGLARSRNHAATMVDAERVLINGKPARKASQTTLETDQIKVLEAVDYVSRAGHKLARALDVFSQIELVDRVALDVGASTGGFTDVLLRRGVAKVFAIDVGHDQIVPELLENKKVVSIEGFNARELSPETLAERAGQAAPEIDVVVGDLSFISLTLVLRQMLSVAPNADFVLLVKPQFEVGKQSLSAHGLVTEALFNDRIGIIARTGHALAQQATMPLQALLKLPWILPPPTEHGRRLVEAFFRNAGLELPAPSVETSDLAILRQLLKSTDMLTAISPHQLMFEIADGSLTELPAQIGKTVRQIGFTLRQGGALSSSAMAVLAAIRAQAQAMEPALQCLAALHSPSTGIVDSHALMLSYLGDMENAGGLLALNASVQEVRLNHGPASHPHVLVMQDGTELACHTLVNSAGLTAPDLTQRMSGLAAPFQTHAYYAKGNYFTLAGRSPFSRLIYPVPEAAGLGVHLTLDLGGQAKFGPDVQWVQSKDDLQVDPARGDAFYAEVRKYWPALPDGALQAGYAGIRPKISGPQAAAADFVIQGPVLHGVPGWTVSVDL